MISTYSVFNCLERIVAVESLDEIHLAQLFVHSVSENLELLLQPFKIFSFVSLTSANAVIRTGINSLSVICTK